MYRNNDISSILFYRLYNNEHYAEIREYLENLKALNIEIDSVICVGCLFRTKLTPYSGEIDPPFRVIDPLTVLGKRLPFRRN